MMRLTYAFLVACLVMAFCIGACCTAQEQADALLTQVATAELANKTVDQIASRVASLAGLRVGVESVDSPGQPIVRSELGAADKQSLASVLDAATAADGRYTWTYANGWIHLIPRKRPCDYLPDRSFSGQLPSAVGVGASMQQLAASLGAEKWQVVMISSGPCVRCGDTAGEPVTGVVAPASGCAVRDVIDFIVARAGGHAWFAVPWRDSRGNVKGTSLLVSL